MATTFTAAEQLLLRYRGNVVRLASLQARLRDLLAAADDPTADNPERDRVQAQIAILQNDVAPVEAFMGDLRRPEVKTTSRIASYARIVELFYFGRNLRRQIADDFHVSERTITRRRSAILRRFAGYLA